MSDPFSGIPDPGTPRPIRRPSQPGLVKDAFRALKETLRPLLPAAERALRRAQRVAMEARWRVQPAASRALLRARQQGRDMWLRGKRNPRTVGAIGGTVALTLAGVIALSASGAGRSLCPPVRDGKAPPFRLLMDSVPQVAAGSKVAIHYDVCGLAPGTPYQTRIRLLPQPLARKKKSAKPKAMVVSFKDQVDGPATRRHEQLDLGSTKPGAYTLELSVADSRGRARKRVQKVVVTR